MANQKIRVGFDDQLQEIEVEVPDHEPPIWDAAAKLDLVGTSVTRVDGVAKVTGRAKYSYDINLPGLLHAAVLRCPHPHARVKSVDTSAAEKLPGVHAVDVSPGKECRFAGDEIGAVAAETPELARQAVGLIKVEYETLPFVVDLEDARDPKAPRVFADQTNVRGRNERQWGNPAAGLAAAEVTVEQTYRTQVQTHVCLETHGVVAKWEDDGSLTVWASTQGTFSVRDGLVGAFGLPRNKVRVITEYMGGGFGSKLGPGVEGVLAATLARKANRPVKLMFDRKGEHLSAGNRPDSVQHMKLGAKKDGTITYYEVETYGTGGVAGGAGCANPMIYNFPNGKKTEMDVFTNAGGARAFRAPGHPQGCFAMEGILDEMAHQLGMDPLDFRMKNDGSPVRQAQYRMGADKIGWQNRQRVPGSHGGRFKRGMGVASTQWGGAGHHGVQVTVNIYRDGTVEALNGAQDIGTGTRTLVALITAEELGLKVTDVQAKIGDTNYPVGPASGGSVTAASLTPAVRDAAYHAKQMLYELVAPKLNAQPGDLEAHDGRICVKSAPDRAMTWKQACLQIKGENISYTGERTPNYRGYRGGVAGVQFAEVEVDTETGIVRVLKVVAVQDCGRVMDRLTTESQIIGGVLQGISYALFEDRLLDPNTGTMVNPNMEEYKLIGPQDTPEIIPITFDVYNGMNNIGCMGIGEPPTIPTSAAIGNAIFNATGARGRQLPMVPSRVMAALKTTA